MEHAGGPSYGLSVRAVYPPTKTLVIVHDEDGNRTEHIEEGHVSQIGPLAKSNQPTEATPRSVPVSPFLRMEEATAYVRAGKKRLLRWVGRGLLPETIDPDGRRFFRRDDLDAVMSGGPVAMGPISSATVHRTKEIRKHESWLHPVQPRTKPRDPERR